MANRNQLVTMFSEPEQVSDDTVVEMQAAYMCSMCDTMILYGNPFEIKYGDLPNLLGKVVRNQLFAGNPYLHQAPMQIPHKCRNGNAGLAYFIGFRKKD